MELNRLRELAGVEQINEEYDVRHPRLIAADKLLALAKSDKFKEQGVTRMEFECIRTRDDTDILGSGYGPEWKRQTTILPMFGDPEGWKYTATGNFIPFIEKIIASSPSPESIWVYYDNRHYYHSPKPNTTENSTKMHENVELNRLRELAGIRQLNESDNILQRLRDPAFGYFHDYLSKKRNEPGLGKSSKNPIVIDGKDRKNKKGLEILFDPYVAGNSGLWYTLYTGEPPTDIVFIRTTKPGETEAKTYQFYTTGTHEGGEERYANPPRVHHKEVPPGTD